jgi:GNAT superfamily N-acetyltransferase
MLIPLKDKLDDAKVQKLLAHSIFPDPERIQNTFDEYKYGSDLELFGFQEEDTIVGIIGFRQDEEQVLEIRHLAVDPELRGFGYGRGQILEVITMKKPKQLMVETDEEAVDFYRSIGFTISSLGEKFPGVERFKCTYIV